MIGLAARVWQHAGLAAATSDALVKLKAAGVTVDRAALDVVAAAAERRGAVLRAVLGRHPAPARPVAFDYRTSSATPAADPAPAALGRGVLPRPLVRRRPRHRPRRAAGLPALPGPGRGRAPTAGRARSTSRPAPTCAPLTAVAGPASRPTGPPWCWSGRGAAHGLRRHAAASPTGATAPRGLGPARRAVRRAPSARRRGARLRRRRRRRGAAGPARRRRRAAARGRGGAAEVRRREPAHATRSAGCCAGALPPGPPRGRRSSRPRADFGVQPEQIVKDLNVLLFCGLPGLGMDDLIDVDLDALEGEGVIRVSNADYLARPLRPRQLGGVRAHRRAAGAARGQRRRRPPDRRPRAGQARGGRRRGRRRSPRRCDIRLPRARPAGSARCATGSPGRSTSSAAGAAGLLRAGPRRVHRAGRRPAAGGHRRRPHLPRRLVPPRRGPAAVPARPDLHAPRCSTRRSSSTPTCEPRDLADGIFQPSHRRPRWSPCGSSPAPAGSRSTTRSRRPRGGPGGGLEVAAAGRRPGAG